MLWALHSSAPLVSCFVQTIYTVWITNGSISILLKYKMVTNGYIQKIGQEIELLRIKYCQRTAAEFIPQTCSTSVLANYYWLHTFVYFSGEMDIWKRNVDAVARFEHFRDQNPDMKVFRPKYSPILRAFWWSFKNAFQVIQIIFLNIRKL